MPNFINSHFDNFLPCEKVVEKDLYVMQSKLFIKGVDFVQIFLKFQEYVDEGKNCQAKMEEIKSMVEDTSIFKENYLIALSKKTTYPPKSLSLSIDIRFHDKCRMYM